MVTATIERGRVRPGPEGAVMATIQRPLGWLRRVLRARRLMAVFAGMADHELRDIGVTRLDLQAMAALPLDADPTETLRCRVEERRAARVSLSGRVRLRVP